MLFTSVQIIQQLKMKFHSGKDRIDDLASADADQDDEVYGDFEDLETGYGDLLRDF